MTKLNLLTLVFTVFLATKSFSQPTTTIKGITEELIATISGPIGEKRDWDKFRDLFLPTASFDILQHSKEGKSRILNMNLEEFIRRVGPNYVIDGFEEVSTGLVVNEFNGIANVFQSYNGKNLRGTYAEKGINSYQLIYQNDRWRIAHISFVNADDENQIPAKYISK